MNTEAPLEGSLKLNEVALEYAKEEVSRLLKELSVFREKEAKAAINSEKAKVRSLLIFLCKIPILV
jgi:hypothetical protein